MTRPRVFVVRIVGWVAALALLGACDSPPSTDDSVSSAGNAAPVTTGVVPSTATSAPTTPTPTTGAPTTEPPVENDAPDELLVDPDPVVIDSITVEITSILATSAVTDALAGPDGHLWVVTQNGRILDADDDARVVLDISERTSADGERGLLGAALDQERGVMWLHHTDTTGDTVVAAYDLIRTATGWSAVAESRTDLVHIVQPYANHNGGDLALAPDGTLLIATGDGGSANDPLRVAHDLSSPLGKLLRLETGPDGHGTVTPADNPWVDSAEPLVFSTGLRNPWRIDIDPLNGDLWIADVGQNRREEINRVVASDGALAGSGVDFGWSSHEADLEMNGDTTAPESATTVWPIHTYDHDTSGCSISGGVVDRSTPGAGLWGWYVFADLCAGDIRALNHLTGDVITLGSVELPTSVARGPAGALVVTAATGSVYRINIVESR